MGSAFSFENSDIKLRLIENIKNKELKDVDEIISAIKECRQEIAQQIEILEQEIPITIETEKKIAVLIRQDQYLKTVRPMHEKYVEPTRKYADIIINGGMNKMALELIRTKIESVLQEEV